MSGQRPSAISSSRSGLRGSPRIVRIIAVIAAVVLLGVLAVLAASTIPAPTGTVEKVIPNARLSH